jgi:hypothetical protein
VPVTRDDDETKESETTDNRYPDLGIKDDGFRQFKVNDTELTGNIIRRNHSKRSVGATDEQNGRVLENKSQKGHPEEARTIKKRNLRDLATNSRQWSRARHNCGSVRDKVSETRHATTWNHEERANRIRGEIKRDKKSGSIQIEKVK